MFKNRFYIFFLLVFCLQIVETRHVSLPLISGDAFRSICDHVYDETNRRIPIQNVRRGDCVFVKTDYLEDFFRVIFPLIKVPFVLISHNSDSVVNESYFSFLEDKKMIHWFAQNVDCSHPKLTPIPVGVQNSYIKDVSVINVFTNRDIAKEFLLYLNVSICTNVKERSTVFNMFNMEPYCRSRHFLSFEDYLMDLKKSNFCLAPTGHGLDCHRTWEALYMGCIPVIVQKKGLELYKGFPVLLLNKWEDATEHFLKSKISALNLQGFDMKRLYFDYWRDLIKSTAKLPIRREREPRRRD